MTVSFVQVYRMNTPVGELHACWTTQGLYSCEFRGRSAATTEDVILADTDVGHAHSDPTLTVNEKQHQFVAAIDLYFKNATLEFDLEQLDWSGLTHFHQRVLRCCFQITAGQTATYGELAAEAGAPKAARAVGSVMANNRWPILIPCHRVVGASGKLTGYSGDGGLATKKWLLDLESSKAACGPQQQLLFH